MYLTESNVIRNESVMKGDFFTLENVVRRRNARFSIYLKSLKMHLYRSKVNRHSIIQHGFLFYFMYVYYNSNPKFVKTRSHKPFSLNLVLNIQNEN